MISLDLYDTRWGFWFVGTKLTNPKSLLKFKYRNLCGATRSRLFRDAKTVHRTVMQYFKKVRQREPGVCFCECSHNLPKTVMAPLHVLHDDVTKWKHFPRYWPIVRGIHRSPVNSHHKGQWRGALMFTLICPNKLLSKPLRRRWFDTPSRSLWRHCNGCGKLLVWPETD